MQQKRGINGLGGDLPCLLLCFGRLLDSSCSVQWRVYSPLFLVSESYDKTNWVAQRDTVHGQHEPGALRFLSRLWTGPRPRLGQVGPASLSGKSLS